MDIYDLAIIGAGPAGYVAAIKAGQLGLKTLLIEKNERLGGTCLNVGCIPSKALLESSHLYHQAQNDFEQFGVQLDNVSFDLSKIQARKVDIINDLTDGILKLIKKNKVELIQGYGKVLSAGKIAVKTDDAELVINAKSILLAMGSKTVELPHIPFDHQNIISSTDALSLQKVPGKLLVIGGGAIGLELGSVYSRLGSSVIVVEMLDRILPFADKMTTQILSRNLNKQGLDIRLKTKVLSATKVLSVNKVSDSIEVLLENKKGETESVTVDTVLVAVGRVPNLDGLDFDKLGITLNERGRIQVDENYQTSLCGVYAVGDLITGPMLAHKAEEEAVLFVEKLAGLNDDQLDLDQLDLDLVPSIVYTSPELSQVGITEEFAKQNNIAIKTGKFFYKANGRAKTMAATEGVVKIISDEQSGKIIAAHIVGENASELISELVLAIKKSMTAKELGNIIHAHPTLSEIVKEAALAAHNQAIHS